MGNMVALATYLSPQEYIAHAFFIAPAIWIEFPTGTNLNFRETSAKVRPEAEQDTLIEWRSRRAALWRQAKLKNRSRARDRRVNYSAA